MSDHASGQQDRKSSGGAMWSAADFWVQQVSQLLTFVLVGNILGPTVVGIMTMALVTTLFLATFLENGFSDTLIQKAELRSDHFDTAFWLMLAIGGVEALVLLGLTPVIAWIFSEPQLKEILPLMAIGLPFIGITACYTGVLQRQLKFRQLATRSIFAYGSGFAVAFLLARHGFGIYSLVGFFLVSRMVDAVLIIAVSGMRPGFHVTREALAEIVDYGKHRVAHQAVTYFTSQFDRFIIGIFLGAHALGLYAIAERLVSALVNGISGVFQRVAFPVLSARQHDRPSFEEAVRNFLTAANLVSIPVFFGLALTSDRLIAVLFTDNWSGVVPLMVVMCAVGLVHPSNYVLTASTNALGYPQIVLKISVIVLVMRVVAGLIGAQFNVMAVAMANASVYLLSLPVFLIVANDLYRGRWGYLFSGSWRPVLASCAMAFAVWPAGRFLSDQNEVVALASEVVIGAVSYAVAIKLLAPALFEDALRMVLRRA